MDKKVFLLDKEAYTEEQANNLTEKDLEEWVAEETYEDNYTMIKIDANNYSSVDDALKSEGILFAEGYWIRTFGF